MCLFKLFLETKNPLHTEHSDIGYPQHDSVCSIAVKLEGPGQLGQQVGVVELEGPGRLGQ